MKKRAIESMTGFGSAELSLPYWGRISCELRSTNHKFLEIGLHLPDGYLSLEERVKNEIESTLKRGRVVCVITVLGSITSEVRVNEGLVKEYMKAVRKIGKQFKMDDKIGMDTLINLPGVLSATEEKISPKNLWSQLKKVVDSALIELRRMRVKEGARLIVHLTSLSKTLAADLRFVEERFKRSINERIPLLKTDVEKSVFLKEVDITEEIERLSFHIGNFTDKLRGSGPVGKELDFICQEMQREANTMGAKSSDTLISGKVVQMKSTIEKLREQVQNIE
jgi:uncharacterized protein (TIGR00255 family)